MTSPHLRAWAALLWSAIILVIIELTRDLLFAKALPIAMLGMPRYLSGVVVGTVLPLLLHLGLAYSALRLLQRGVSARLLWPITAALFGLVWHVTLVQKDGIRSMGGYWLIRALIAAILAFGLAAFAHLILNSQRWALKHRRLLLAVALLLGLLINLRYFVAYRQFHGHLSTALCVMLAWLLSPYMYRRALRLGALIIVVGLCLLSLTLLPERALVEGYVRRLTRVTGPVLETLPLSRLLLLPTEPLVDPEMLISPEQMRSIAARSQAHAQRPTPSAAGRSVVLIVLEATRSDYWSDPELTPRFHQWRRHGLYAPTAIAQYPATPLAYGAMFTGQYPSILAQSPHWGKHRLFGAIEGRFDRLILSRPDIKWFDHSAISSFFLPFNTAQNKHQSAVDALKHMQVGIESAVREGQSFFAWVHLYEPHAPYQIQDDFPFGDEIKARYRSEIAWLDQQLGPFMEWLLSAPLSEETLVIVMADHGEGLGEIVYGEPYLGHHVHVNSLVSHIPLFVAGPGIPKETVRTDLRPAQIDLMPTLFEFLGEPIPPELYVQGVSLQAQLEENTPRALVTEAFSLRGGRFFDFVFNATRRDPAALRAAFRRMNEVNTYAPKLGLEYTNDKIIYDTALRRQWLYNLSNDPEERRDLTNEQQDLAKEMQERLEEWRRTQAWTLKMLERLH